MQSLQAIGACFHGMSLSQGLIVSLFLAGLVGGFSHCVAMCGPFVMAQSGHVEKVSQAFLLPYHLGRITTYTGLAAVLSSLLNIVFLYAPVRAYVVAPVLVLAGLIFFVSAFPQLGKVFPWVSAVKISLPYRWFSNGFQKLSHNPNGFKRFGMGLLLGFLPCGLVTSALMAAATAPDVLQAAISMAAFGGGTMPALIITAFAGQALQMRYPKAMPYVMQGMMVWSGLWLFIMAGLILI